MSKKHNSRQLDEIIEDPLGDDDIRHYLPDAKIMKHSKLANYKTIDDLLPENPDYAFILYEDSPNKGHWICVSRYDDTVEYFDSYGGKPDDPLKWTPEKVRVGLGSTHPFLRQLFNATDKKVVYNPIKYQKEGADINDCGRHCVFRIKNLLHRGYDLDDYYRQMNFLRKKNGFNYDEVVSNIIDIVN